MKTKIRILIALVLLSAAALTILFGSPNAQPSGNPQTEPKVPPPTGAAAEAQSTGPGKEIKWANVPERVPTGAFKVEASEEVDEPLSDIDPVTLYEMKKRVFVPPYQGAQFPPSVNYSATEDKPANESPALLAPNLIRNFASFSNADQTDGFVHTPPDTNLAAGPNHVMVTVNALVGTYSKTGTLLSKKSMSDVFANVCTSCSAQNYFDPHITYDSVAGHWIVVELYKDISAGVSKILVAISQSSDPTGNWWNYSLNAVLNYSGENTWADYPDVGFDGIAAASGGAVYITVNQFTFSGNPHVFRTAALYILAKSQLYSGSSVNYWRAWGRTNSDGSQAFTLRASKTYGNPGGEFLINSRNSGSTVTLWRVNPTYPPNPVNWTLRSTINIGSYLLPPPASQLGTTDVIDTLDNRIYNAVWRNNRLYAAFTRAHNWGSGTVAAVHYLKINTSNNTPEINQTFGADGLHYYCPAIATDNANNIVLVFSRSNSTEYAGARYSGRLTCDTRMQDSAQLKAGTVPLLKRTGQSKSRWGDYQATAIDPSDGAKVWIYGEWAASLPGINNDYKWGTWVAQVRFALLPPTANAATNITTNSFVANWRSVIGASSYRLDVSTNSAFTSYVPGYQNLNVGNVLNRSVIGLNASTTYYYRVRASNGNNESCNSNVVNVTTLGGTPGPFGTWTGTGTWHYTCGGEGTTVSITMTLTPVPGYPYRFNGTFRMDHRPCTDGYCNVTGYGYENGGFNSGSIDLNHPNSISALVVQIYNSCLGITLSYASSFEGTINGSTMTGIYHDDSYNVGSTVNFTLHKTN